MDERIHELMTMFTDRIVSDIDERGIDRIDIEDMGELVDIVKDLAETKALCRKAAYYESVVNAMEGSPSHGEGENEVVGMVRTALQQAGPDEREKLRRELRKVAGLL